MKRGVIALAAVLVLASAALAVAAATGGKATGGVNHTTVAGFQAHRSFNAQGTPTDAKGQVETRITDPVTGALVRQWHGEVDCYQPLDATTARFSGVVTNSQGGEEVEGEYFRWTVRDNGEGANAPPDQIAAERFANKPASACTLGTTPAFDAVSGNIQVKNK
jgi:hypothetical protein